MPSRERIRELAQQAESASADHVAGTAPAIKAIESAIIEALAEQREEDARLVYAQMQAFAGRDGLSADFARGWIAQCAAAIRSQGGK